MADVKITDLQNETTLNNSDSFVIEQSANGTRRTTLTTLKKSIVGDTAIDGMGGTTVTEAINLINKFLMENSSAEFHNSIFRGKSLGTSVTSNQWTAISSGKFTDMFVGDYWTIDNVVYRIAGFSLFFGRGANTRHVVIVPDAVWGSSESTDFAVMNDTATNAGGYLNSKMCGGLEATDANISYARSVILSAFGSHVLTRTVRVSSTISGGEVTGVTAILNADVVPMVSENVLGFSVEKRGTSNPTYNDSVQFPLFALAPRYQVLANKRYRLRDVIDTDGFAVFGATGMIVKTAANANNIGIRPCFCIY